MQTAIDRLTQEGTRWLTIDALKDGAAEIERLRIERDDLQVLLKGRTAEFQAEIERLRAERDAERALADQLARALLDGPFRGDRRDRMYGSGWADVHDALDAWQEARRER
jgi:hypothetical protein